MKNIKYSLFVLLFFLFGATKILAQEPYRAFQIQQAQETLSERNEVYFKFIVDNREILNQLTLIVSIDRYDSRTGEVHAYANTKEFETFLSHNIDFEVLKAPSIVDFEVKMLTLEDLKSKGFTDTWDSYPTYDAYVALMYQFQTDFPGLCKIHNIGTMTSGRSLLFAQISANVNQKEAEPRFMYTSTMHGDETTGYVLMLRLIHYLLNSYATDTEIAYLLNNMDIWICPNENPDGTYYGGNNTVSGARRSNANGVDLNRNYPNPVSTISNQQFETLRMMGFTDTLKFVMSANQHGGAEVVNYPWDSWYSSEKTHADHNWWYFVSREYADTARFYSPSSYLNSFDNGVTHGADWYKVYGSRQDFMGYYRYLREVTLELSNTKLLPASQLPAHWNYNYRSYLNYMRQALYGIKGIIKDGSTGEPMVAKVEVLAHDKDNSQVYSQLPHGNYHRPLLAGTYSLKFSANGYNETTINNIQVQNYQTVELDVLLYSSSQYPSPTGLTYSISNIKDIVLTWNAPSYSAPLVLENYKIYRNGTFLAQTTNLTYTDPNLNPGSYSYYVIATYSNPAGESNPSNTVIINHAYYTLTATAGSNGTITPSGSLTVAPGANQSYSFTPAIGYHVGNVLVNGTSVGAPSSYQFSNINANQTIHVSFAKTTYSITATPNDISYGSVTGSGTYDEGQTVTLTATPSQYYHFVEWKEGDAVVSTNPTISFTATANRNLVAYFGIHEYTISATSNNPSLGAISGEGIYKNGQQATLNATESTNCHFVNWTEGGTEVSTFSNYTFTVLGNRDLVANFAFNTYTISASAIGNGTITPAGSVQVTHGANQNFTISALAGSFIGDVKVDGVNVGSPSNYSFNNVTKAHAIEATFIDDQPNYHTISITSNGQGLVSPSGNLNIVEGSDATITITPNPNYHIGEVAFNDASVINQVTISPSGIGVFTLNNVTESATLHIRFDIDTYIIVASAGANGTITPAGNVAVDHDASQSFSIIPNEFYHVSDVRVDGVSVGAVSAFTFEDVTSTHTINAYFEPNMVIITATAGLWGSISPSGNVLVNQGSTQTFTITPNNGAHTIDVLVDGESVGIINTYTFENVNTNRTIEALFDLNTYTINASAGSNGSISPSGEITVYHGSNLSFSITPDANFEILDVIVNGQSLGAISSFNLVNISSDNTISAIFSQETYTISATAEGNGSISPSGNTMVLHGSNQSFTITPDIGYHISNVLVDGGSVGVLESYAFENVTSDHSIRAVFQINTYTITATAGANGSISPDGATPKTFGDTQTFTITPDTEYHVEDIIVDGESVSAVTSYTFSNISADGTIHATFAINTYTLSMNIVGNGTVTANETELLSPQAYDYGTLITLKAIPDEGWRFSGWSIDLVGEENPTTITMMTNKMVTATFSPNVGVGNDYLSSIEVFPNPFATSISLRNTSNLRRIVISNILGEEVMVIENNGYSDLTIQTGRLNEGAYFMLLQTNDGLFRMVKMVKAH